MTPEKFSAIFKKMRHSSGAFFINVYFCSLK